MLTRKVGLKRGKRINRVSKKHKIELAVYSDKRKAYLLRNPYCVVCGCLASQIHHKARRGKNLNNEETWMSVCQPCHQYCHDNQKEAEKKGYIIREYN
jgi:5-methylcytosine-specific restriction endonuclease McrA